MRFRGIRRTLDCMELSNQTMRFRGIRRTLDSMGLSNRTMRFRGPHLQNCVIENPILKGLIGIPCKVNGNVQRKFSVSVFEEVMKITLVFRHKYRYLICNNSVDPKYLNLGLNVSSKSDRALVSVQCLYSGIDAR